MKVLARFKTNEPGQTFTLPITKSSVRNTTEEKELCFFKPQTCIASDFIEFKDLTLLFLRQTLWRTFIVSSMEEHFRHKVNYRLLYTSVDETLTK